MKLFYFKREKGNLGDDLNAYLWPKLLGDLEQYDSSQTFVGIGSILDERIMELQRAVVFGTGTRSATPNLETHRGLDVRFVRGPLSATCVPFDGCRFITDPAYAVRFLPRFQSASEVVDRRVAFIPHYSSLHRVDWKELCDEIGWTFISPEFGVPESLERIRSSKLVVAEAMHGAILADAFRVPWVRVNISSYVREGETAEWKWRDWTESVGVDAATRTMPMLWPPSSNSNVLRTFKRKLKLRLLRAMMKSAARGTPKMSDDAVFNSRLEQLGDAIEDLKNDFRRVTSMG